MERNPDAIFWIALGLALGVVLLAAALGPRDTEEVRLGNKPEGSTQGHRAVASSQADVTAPVPTETVPTDTAPTEPAPEDYSPQPAPTDAVPTDTEPLPAQPAPEDSSTLPAPGPR